MSKNLSFHDQPTRFMIMDVLRGICALMFAWIIIKFCNVQQISGFLNRWKNRCNLEVTHDEALKIWNGIQYAKRLFWNRMACLESSLAFVLFANSKRRKVEWCVGVKLAPFQSHAWVEIQGEPYQETENIQMYKKIVSV